LGGNDDPECDEENEDENDDEGEEEHDVTRYVKIGGYE